MLLLASLNVNWAALIPSITRQVNSISKLRRLHLPPSSTYWEKRATDWHLIKVVDSVTRLGYFKKVLGKKISYKSTPDICQFYWLLKNTIFKVETGTYELFCHFLKKLGYFLFWHLVALFVERSKNVSQGHLKMSWCHLR